MHELSGGGLRITVDPEDGGRITSLLAHDRQWLVPTGPRNPDGSFLGPGTGGWDDIAPTIAACQVPRWGQLPDHGDAWRRPWTVISVGPDHIDTTVDLRTVPLTIRRRIDATTERIRLSWTVTTTTPEAVPVFWSAHPLFAAPPGTRIDYDPNAGLEPVVGTATPGTPTRPTSIDDLGPGHVLKLFAAQRDWASVVHADGAAVHLSWDPRHLPYLGLYYDRDVYTNRPVVAPEPTTAPHDAADVVLNRLPVVNPTTPMHWWIDVTANPTM